MIVRPCTGFGIHQTETDSSYNPDMRILHILDHSLPLQSGYVFRTLSILEHQRKLGWQTFHLTTPRHKQKFLPVETVDGWEFYRTPPVSSIAGRLPVFREFAEMEATTRRLDEVIRDIKPDILHAHSPVLNAIPAIRAGKRHGIPVNYEIRALWEDAGVSHGSHSEWGLRYRAIRALETHAIRRADSITTICQGLKDEIGSRGIAGDKVTIIPNAVDVDSFSTDMEPDVGLTAELGMSGKTVIGFVGSFYHYEGLHLLLQAMPDIIAADPNIRLLMVGGGDEADRLNHQAVELGIADAVIFTGRVHHSEVQRYYSLIDVLVYPRLKIRLTDLVTPLKPLEAMAQNKIVIASDIGGHNELITDGVTGDLFRADDAKALAATVMRVTAHRENWAERRENGRRFVETERSWETVVNRYKDVYGRLIANSQPH